MVYLNLNEINNTQSEVGFIDLLTNQQARRVTNGEGLRHARKEDPVIDLSAGEERQTTYPREPDCHNIPSESADINNTARWVPCNHIPPSGNDFNIVCQLPRHEKMGRREETWGRSEWSGECRGES